MDGVGRELNQVAGDGGVTRPDTVNGWHRKGFRLCRLEMSMASRRRSLHLA
jgi:hypothetical protein